MQGDAVRNESEDVCLIRHYASNGDQRALVVFMLQNKLGPTAEMFGIEHSEIVESADDLKKRKKFNSRYYEMIKMLHPVGLNGVMITDFEGACPGIMTLLAIKAFLRNHNTFDRNHIEGIEKDTARGIRSLVLSILKIMRDEIKPPSYVTLHAIESKVAGESVTVRLLNSAVCIQKAFYAYAGYSKISTDRAAGEAVRSLRKSALAGIGAIQRQTSRIRSIGSDETSIQHGMMLLTTPQEADLVLERLRQWDDLKVFFRRASEEKNFIQKAASEIFENEKDALKGKP